MSWRRVLVGGYEKNQTTLWNCKINTVINPWIQKAPVAELVYAQRLGRCPARVRGSSPLRGTEMETSHFWGVFILVWGIEKVVNIFNPELVALQILQGDPELIERVEGEENIIQPEQNL